MSISLKPLSFGTNEHKNTPIAGKIAPPPLPKKPGTKRPQPIGGLITPPTPKKPPKKNPGPMAGSIVPYLPQKTYIEPQENKKIDKMA